MIAEIKGKLNDSRLSEAERLEDELTGNFFGCLRYIPFSKGLKHILKSIYPPKLAWISDVINIEKWFENTRFWDNKNQEGEPDILLEFDNVVILIEVKYNSGLSSPDQLEKYGELLHRISAGREKILILLAQEREASTIYNSNITDKERSLINDVLFGYMTWQKIYDTLKTLETVCALNQFEQVIINDLINLLNKKGFEGFRSFDIGGLVADSSINWLFDYNTVDTKSFSFSCEQKVERGLYYEFR